MLRILYTLAVLSYLLVVYLAVPFSRRARNWAIGRRRMWKLLSAVPSNRRVVWIHCASLGEFEQARPILEALRSESSEAFLLLTFYSPSGYEVRKNYAGVDLVSYLPSDMPWNVRRFLSLVRPEAALFIKYEFWFNYIAAAHKKGVKLYSVSAIFRPNQHFFRTAGGWQRRHLSMFRHFFVQDNESAELLMQIGLKDSTVSGDTRFDRVIDIPSLPLPESVKGFFSSDDIVLVAGSTYAADEKILQDVLQYLPELKMIIAPHETTPLRVKQLQGTFQSAGETRLFSEGPSEECRILIVDQVGLLSRLYGLGQLAYIGGGFGKGIHNTLEAATHGIPLCFGPECGKFREASMLMQSGAATLVHNSSELKDWLTLMTFERSERESRGAAARTAVLENLGATKRIMQILAEDLQLHPIREH